MYAEIESSQINKQSRYMNLICDDLLKSAGQFSNSFPLIVQMYAKAYINKKTAWLAHAVFNNKTNIFLVQKYLSTLPP
ncbi:hypothetical protein DBR40_26180 [Pedobacter sp. KBW01]|nr:hypothetical protein DBR40_26180 [Pedobacter sp. KBW01]